MFLILRAKSLCLLKSWLSNSCPRESIFHDSNWKVTSLHNHRRDEQMLQRDMLHPLNPSTSDHQYLHEIIYSCGSCVHICIRSSSVCYHDFHLIVSTGSHPSFWAESHAFKGFLLSIHLHINGITFPLGQVSSSFSCRP